MNPIVDMVIPVAPKDLVKLPYTISAVRRFVDVRTIHVVTPVPGQVRGHWPNTVLHSDSDVLPYDRSSLRYRPNWVFQQMVKLLQDVTESDWYVVMDSDVFPNQPIPLWTEEGKPLCHLGRDQPPHPPYWVFNDMLLGFGKIHPQSFINEFMLVNKELIRGMLSFCGLPTRDAFWARLVEIVNDGCYPAEPELYFSYLLREHPDVYSIYQLETTMGGRYETYIFSDEEVRDHIHTTRGSDPSAHLISLHSWVS